LSEIDVLWLGVFVVGAELHVMASVQFLRSRRVQFMNVVERRCVGWGGLVPKGVSYRVSYTHGA
jgi:hypothetical protein